VQPSRLEERRGSVEEDGIGSGLLAYCHGSRLSFELALTLSVAQQRDMRLPPIDTGGGA
jgi:hypothetical protein